MLFGKIIKKNFGVTLQLFESAASTLQGMRALAGPRCAESFNSGAGPCGAKSRVNLPNNFIQLIVGRRAHQLSKVAKRWRVPGPGSPVDLHFDGVAADAVFFSGFLESSDFSAIAADVLKVRGKKAIKNLIGKSLHHKIAKFFAGVIVAEC
jgi:hypothetical protein